MAFSQHGGLVTEAVIGFGVEECPLVFGPRQQAWIISRHWFSLVNAEFNRLAGPLGRGIEGMRAGVENDERIHFEP